MSTCVYGVRCNIGAPSENGWKEPWTMPTCMEGVKVKETPESLQYHCTCTFTTQFVLSTYARYELSHPSQRSLANMRLLHFTSCSCPRLSLVPELVVMMHVKLFVRGSLHKSLFPRQTRLHAPFLKLTSSPTSQLPDNLLPPVTSGLSLRHVGKHRPQRNDEQG